jgi:hypothetical protein
VKVVGPPEDDGFLIAEVVLARREAEVGRSGEDAVERGDRLRASQRGAHAEVRTVAEGEDVVRDVVSLDVEALRVGERGPGALAGQNGDHLRADRRRHARELRVDADRPAFALPGDSWDDLQLCSFAVARTGAEGK